MFFHSKRAALTTLIFATLVTAGCGTASKADAPVAEQAAAVQIASPVKVAFLQDKTGSANWTRTPQPTVDELQMLIDLLRQTGGELGVGLIRDQSNRGLLRLRIDPPPRPVAKPLKTLRPFRDARRMEQYRKDTERYHGNLAGWTAETDRRIARFKTDALVLLDSPANARSTDVWGAVRRADLFLNESDATWHSATHQWAIFATDGLHNRRGVAPATLRGHAKVIVINGAAQFGSLTALHPEAFESVTAAFRHISATEGGHK